jgi:uncharacterized membrane protein
MPESSANTRLEAFSDGVFAIALTLLVIDIKIPEMESLRSTQEVWHALRHLGPAAFAFVLSFAIVFITWVNHQRTLRLVHDASASFIYANALLLLTVVFIPFPTSLLGAFVRTDHAAPAVVLYNVVLAVQALGWLLLTSTALNDRLPKSERAISTVREQRQFAYFGIALYSALAVTAFWLPVTVAIVTTATWILWLVLSIRAKT